MNEYQSYKLAFTVQQTNLAFKSPKQKKYFPMTLSIVLIW
uniref:Uncharacterized protein n=1 Tax=Lepeophtheirus salmonis TaxID=72036 RepID=A0A0K2V364_LEPSM